MVKKHDEEDIKRACEEILRRIQNGQKKDIKGTALRHDIPYSTLYGRFNNISLPRAEARQAQQFLSPAQENVLVKWTEHLGFTGLLHAHHQRPSKNWIYSFLDRHPGIVLALPTGLDPKRAKAFNEPVVGRHFDKLAALIEEHGIPIENVYNMDEKGCQRGGGKKGSRRKYFYSRRQKAKIKHRSGNLELITIIEAVCADGSSLKPGFVFPGVAQCPEWFEVDDEIITAMSANGWTDDLIGFMWVLLSFIPQATKRNKSGKPILLILDGHGSHETIKIIDLADKHNIIILILPPHTTHKLQPLDVGVFGPFSRAWIDRCDTIVAFTGSEMRKEDFVKEYMDVRAATFRPSVIISAFKKSGQWPVNRNVFTAADYAPSIPYSTEARDVPDLPSVGATISVLPLPPPPKRRRRQGAASSVSSDTDSSDDSDFESDYDSDFDSSSPVPPAPSSAPPADLPLSSPAPLPSPPPALSSSSLSSTPTSHASRSIAASQTTTPSRHFYHDPVLFARIAQLEAEVQGLRGHAIMVEEELSTQKRRMNERNERGSKKRKLNVESRVLTSAEGKRLAAEKEAERAVKDKKKDENNERRKEKENLRNLNRQNRDPDAPYTGLLTAKNKDDLKDIAVVLGQSDEGTKPILLERINRYFRDHPAERDGPKFSGLFKSAPRGRRTGTALVAGEDPPPLPLSDGPPMPSSSRLPPSTPLHDLPLQFNGQPYQDSTPYQNSGPPFTFVSQPPHSQYSQYHDPNEFAMGPPFAFDLSRMPSIPYNNHSAAASSSTTYDPPPTPGPSTFPSSLHTFQNSTYDPFPDMNFESF